MLSLKKRVPAGRRSVSIAPQPISPTTNPASTPPVAARRNKSFNTPGLIGVFADHAKKKRDSRPPQLFDCLATLRMKPTRTLVTFLLVALAIGLTAVAFQNDTRVREAIVTAQGKGWKKTTEAATIGAISKYGDWPQLMAVALVGIFLAWRFRRPEWTRILIACMIASTLAGLLANTSRLTTGRARPRDEAKIGAGFHGPFQDGKLTVGNSKYNAFPSGHTATAVGFAGVLLFARPLVGLVAIALALLIAWSRMALGAHHISDVTVSTILALAVAWFTWRAAQKHGNKIGTWVRSKLKRS